MKSVTEILAAVYNSAFWRVIDEWGDYCVFCGASDGKDQFERGEIHHYADCLLREIRAHLMGRACFTRRTLRSADTYARSLGLLNDEASPTQPRLEWHQDSGCGAEMSWEQLKENGHQCEPLPTDPPYPDYGSGGSPPGASSEPSPTDPIYLGNNASGSTVVLPPDRPSLAKEIERIVDEVFAPEPKAPDVVPEHVVYRTARAEPEVVPVVEPERLHSWQSMKSGKAVRCTNCGLAVLSGAPPVDISVCPGRNPDLPAPVEVKAVAPAVPLVQVMCPRCHVAEVAPATGGTLPDLPQITLSGPFMVVSWVDPAHGRQTGVYCKLCWSDTTASFITASLQPAVLCRPTPVSGPGPGQLA